MNYMLVNEERSFKRESCLSSLLLSFITIISALVEAVILLITIAGSIRHCHGAISSTKNRDTRTKVGRAELYIV